MNSLKVIILTLLLTPALYAQTALPALPAGLIAIGGPGGTGATTAEGALASLVASNDLYDAAGHLLATCKNHDLDTNSFTGCRIVEDRTDEVFSLLFQELQRTHDNDRPKP